MFLIYILRIQFICLRFLFLFKSLFSLFSFNIRSIIKKALDKIISQKELYEKFRKITFSAENFDSASHLKLVDHSTIIFCFAVSLNFSNQTAARFR